MLTIIRANRQKMTRMGVDVEARWSVQVLPYEGTTEDRFGNETKTWDEDNPRTEMVYGWAPPARTTASTETNTWRDAVTADLSVYAPPSFTVDPLDRMVVDGKTYEVDGEVEDYNHGPFGFTPGVVVNLKRAEAL